jgi:hypothetical protein
LFLANVTEYRTPLVSEFDAARKFLDCVAFSNLDFAEPAGRQFSDPKCYRKPISGYPQSRSVDEIPRIDMPQVRLIAMNFTIKIRLLAMRRCLLNGNETDQKLLQLLATCLPHYSFAAMRPINVMVIDSGLKVCFQAIASWYRWDMLFATHLPVAPLSNSLGPVRRSGGRLGR